MTAPIGRHSSQPRAEATPAPDGTFYVTVGQPPTRPRALMVLVNWLQK